MELTVIEKDRLGLLTEVSEALHQSRINIHTIFVNVNSAGKAMVRVGLPQRAVGTAIKALREAGFNVASRNV